MDQKKIQFRTVVLDENDNFSPMDQLRYGNWKQRQKMASKKKVKQNPLSGWFSTKDKDLLQERQQMKQSQKNQMKALYNRQTQK